MNSMTDHHPKRPAVFMVLVLAILVGSLYLAGRTSRLAPVAPPTPSGASSPVHAASTTPPEPSRAVMNGWVAYENPRYHYRFSYPPTARVGDDYGVPPLDLVYVAIDPNAEPIHVCAADNPQHWTSRQVFEEWKRKPPVESSEEFPCADYPSYAQLNASTVKMGGREYYQVASFRGPFETICSYLASPKIVLAVCTPPEDPRKAGLQARFTVYKELLESVQVPE